MILAGKPNEVHRHSEILGAPVFIRPALRLDDEPVDWRDRLDSFIGAIMERIKRVSPLR